MKTHRFYRMGTALVFCGAILAAGILLAGRAQALLDPNSQTGGGSNSMGGATGGGTGSGPSLNSVGTLVFSPTPPVTIKNGQAFTITVTGAPAYSPTTIFVDNNDGRGYQNFGGWVTTDAAGNIKADRILNCSAYLTYTPNQAVDITKLSNPVLTQNVYLKYANGAVSPIATSIKDCNIATQTTTPLPSGPIYPVNGVCPSPLVYIPSLVPYCIEQPKQDASTIATCGAQPDGSYKPCPVQSVASLPHTMPAGSNYTISGVTGSFSAAYNYAPPAPKIATSIYGGLVKQNHAYLGQADKSIFVLAPHDYGPVMRWRLTDPFNPAGPDMLHFLKNIPGHTPASPGGEGPFPANFNGCINYGHEPHIGLLVPAESESGEDIVHFAHGFGCGIPGAGHLVGRWSAGAGDGSIAQMYGTAADGGNLFGYDTNDSYGRVAVSKSVAAAMPNGNYFFYLAKSAGVEIFDWSNLSGSLDSDFLRKSSTLGWSNVYKLEIANMPSGDQILIGETPGTPGATVTMRLGKIDQNTGRLTGTQKTQTLNVKRMNGGGDPGSFTNMEVVHIGSKVYVVAVEDLNTTAGAYIGHEFATWGYHINDITFGFYLLDPATLNLTREGGVTIKGVQSTGNYVFGMQTYDNWRVAEDPSGTAYPVLLLPARAPEEYVIQAYGLKKFLGKDTTVSEPDFTVRQVFNPTEIRNGVKVAHLKQGDLVVPPYNFQAFVKSENGKANLYLYRHAYLFAGPHIYQENPYEVHYPDPAYSYIRQGEGGWSNVNWNGIPSLRVDRVDVTSISGTPSGTTPPPATTTPTTPTTSGGLPPLGGGVPIPPPPSSTDPCFNTYRNLCDAVEQLRTQFCALIPDSDLCNVQLR